MWGATDTVGRAFDGRVGRADLDAGVFDEILATPGLEYLDVLLLLALVPHGKAAAERLSDKQHREQQQEHHGVNESRESEDRHFEKIIISGHASMDRWLIC